MKGARRLKWIALACLVCGLGCFVVRLTAEGVDGEESAPSRFAHVDAVIEKAVAERNIPGGVFSLDTTDRSCIAGRLVSDRLSRCESR